MTLKVHLVRILFCINAGYILLISEFMASTLKKNSFIVFSTQGLQLIVSVFMSLMLPKLLSVESFGFWQLFIFYTQYGGFAHFGLYDGIYLREGGKVYSDLNFNTLAYQLRISLLYQIAIGVVFVSIASQYLEGDRLFVMYASVVYVLLNNMCTYSSFILQATNRMKEFSMGRVIDSITFATMVVFLFCSQVYNAKVLILCFILGRMFSFLYYQYNTIEIYSKIIVKHIGSYKEDLIINIKNGVSLMFANIMGMLILGICRFYVDAHWGVIAFSQISFALTLSNFLLLFFNQASLVLFPELRRWSTERIVAFYERSNKYLYIITPVALFLYYPISYFIKFWLPDYSISCTYLIYFIPLCVFDAKMQMIYSTLLRVNNKVKEIFYINLFALGITILMIIISYCLFDELRVVVFAMFLSIYARSIFSHIYISKMLQKPIRLTSLLFQALYVLGFVLINNLVDTKESLLIVIFSFGLLNFISKRYEHNYHRI